MCPREAMPRAAAEPAFGRLDSALLENIYARRGPVRRQAAMSAGRRAPNPCRPGAWAFQAAPSTLSLRNSRLGMYPWELTVLREILIQQVGSQITPTEAIAPDNPGTQLGRRADPFHDKLIQSAA
jgi:hypothetical protein